VSSLGVVEVIHVIGDGGSCDVPARIHLAAELGFEGAEEALDDGVIVQSPVRLMLATRPCRCRTVT
jgi:hypothetical protein